MGVNFFVRMYIKYSCVFVTFLLRMNSFHFLFRDIAGGVLPYLPPLPRAPSTSSGAKEGGGGCQFPSKNPMFLRKTPKWASKKRAIPGKNARKRAEKRLKTGGLKNYLPDNQQEAKNEKNRNSVA